MNPARYPHDAIIVLANHMDERGQLNTESRARADAAIAAYRAGEAPTLFTTGWTGVGQKRPIAEVMREYAIDCGVPAQAVIADPRSRDTVGDAVFSKQAGFTRPLVVTSEYHAARAGQIFALVYGAPVAVRAVPSADTPEIREAEARSLAAFLATFAGVAPHDDAAIWSRLVTRHPFYNGAVYPSMAG